MGEPRRSGRATKGQHTKLELDAVPAVTVAAPNKRGKKGGKKSTEEPDDEEDSIIRCVCGATEDEEGWMMISCEECTAWQHNLCMDVTEVEANLPEVYYCEKCKPENHKALLAAMARGEEPWAARIVARVEAEKKKKKGRGRKSGRPSGAAANSEAASSPRAQSHKSPTPAVAESGTKRKYEAVVEIPNGQGRKASASRTSASAAPSTEAPEPPKSSKRAKSVSEQQASRKPSQAQASPTPRPTTLEHLPKSRMPVAKALHTDLLHLVPALIEKSLYQLPSGDTTESKCLSIALDVENGLHSRFGTNDVQGYGAQFRSIKHNIKANETLLQQVLTGSVTAEELAGMSSEDMASEELQKERQRLKEEADKHATLAHEEGPRYRKTHKGDELIGGDSAPKTAGEIYQPPVRRGTVEHTPSDVHIDTGSPPPGAELPDDYDRPVQSVSEQQPASRPIASVKATDSAPQAGQKQRHVNQSSHSGRDNDVVMGDAADDADIDLILKGDQGDRKPPRPTTGRDNNILWSGKVEMKTIAAFQSTASWVAGADVGQKIPYNELLRSGVEIDGRIDIKRANDYVAGMRTSTSTDVCCLALAPARNDADREGYRSIFNYFKEKNRWGVFAGHGNDKVRDVYLVTVEAGGPEKLPGFITMLAQSRIDSHRQNDLLLLTLVVKAKTPAVPAPPMPLQQQQQQQHHISNPPTPVNPQHPTFSPVAQGTPTFQQPVAVSNMAIQILGPFINAPVVTQILTSVTDMSDVQLQNLRDILEREPAARDDIIKLSEHLTQRQKVAEGN